jgi:hypothetical protein
LAQAIDDLVNKFHLGDFVYEIRERVSGSEWFKDHPTANAWDHPDVVRFGKCIEILKRSIE